MHGPRFIPLFVLFAFALPTACWAQEKANENTAAFSPESNFLALLDGKGKIRIWEAATGKERQPVTFPCGPADFSQQVRYLPGGELVVLLSRETEKAQKRSASLLNLSTGKRSPFIEVERGPLAICPNGKVLVSTCPVLANISEDVALVSKAHLWKVSTGKKLREVNLSKGWVFGMNGTSIHKI